ncbi:hypothetical protein [Francisella sp. 19X1-34]|uniref:hypothetical protein n=1 Tax=Francisella sp. 19X1-34 TaxID=3087177 RepID=UPI002E2FC131|nr:hypothetical protein [Francisella sp. 19X1-34]MED7789394.1 hypothetical protein [Francisella sp. 19X1-34]
MIAAVYESDINGVPSFSNSYKGHNGNKVDVEPINTVSNDGYDQDQIKNSKNYVKQQNKNNKLDLPSYKAESQPEIYHDVHNYRNRSFQRDGQIQAKEYKQKHKSSNVYNNLEIDNKINKHKENFKNNKQIRGTESKQKQNVSNFNAINNIHS